MGKMVSIIVPVYNAEKYIGRCIESILNQEYKDFELILVNDGSKDSSGDILKRYAQKDERIRLIEKENTGVSDTRNKALEAAEGEYIQFLDSDDWMTPDSTKLLVAAAKEQECDLVIADFYRVVGKHVSQKGDIDTDAVMNRQEFAACMMQNPADFYYGVLWNKLYKREILEKYQIQMDPKVSWCEDFLFNLEYIRHAHRFYALQAPVYYYVKTEGSLVSQNLNINKTIKMKFNMFEYYNEFYKDVYDDKEYETIQPQLYSFFFKAASDAFVLPPVLANDSYKLGQERIYISKQALLQDGDIVMGQYRLRKLIEHYCQTVGAKYNLNVHEALTLVYLKNPLEEKKMEDLADYLGIPKISVIMLMQKLIRKEFVQTNDSKYFILTREAERITKEIEQIGENLTKLCMEGFSEDEKAQFMQLSLKAKENVRNALVVISESYRLGEE